MENNISFDESKYHIKSRAILGQSEIPGMTRFLIKKGIVKTEKQAQITLLTITLISLLLSIYIFAVYVFDVKLFNQTPKQTPEQIQLRQERLEKMKQLREQQQNNTNNPQ